MWSNPQFPMDMVTFTEETLNGKLHFFYIETPLILSSSKENARNLLWTIDSMIHYKCLTTQYFVQYVPQPEVTVRHDTFKS